MGNVAIRADGLSKHYRIGAGTIQHNTLRDHLMHRLKALTRRGEDSSDSDTSFWALNRLRAIQVPSRSAKNLFPDQIVT